MLSLDQASKMVDAALSQGAALGCAPLTVAVLDPGGHLLVLKRQDGSAILRPQIAEAKAWGALGMGVGTRGLAERATVAPQFFTALAALSDGRVVPVPGGCWSATARAPSLRLSASAATTPSTTKPARSSPSNITASPPTPAR